MDLEIKEYSDAPIKNICTGEEYNITKKKKIFQNREKDEFFEKDNTTVQQNFNKTKT